MIKWKQHKLRIWKVFLATMMACAGGWLGATKGEAGYKIYSPLVEKGEIELEWRGWYDIDDAQDKDGRQQNKFALGYGVTERWFTELYGEVERDAGENGYEFKAVEWANRLQLTEQGQYWMDVGLYFSYETTVKEKTADKVEAMILLEKSLDRFTHRVNVIFEKEVGGGAREETEAGLALSSRYRWRSVFEPGIEWYSSFGELNEGKSFDEQKHRVGPVFYGKVGPVKYDIGYLFGVSDAAVDGVWKWVLEYEYHF